MSAACRILVSSPDSLLLDSQSLADINKFIATVGYCKRMQKLLPFVLTAISAALAAGPAQACIDIAEFKIEDIRFADAIVVGRISNYEIIEDKKVRSVRARMLERSDLPPQVREGLDNQTSWLSDYAVFNIDVEQIISGNLPKRIKVTWDNSTFSEPEKFPSGPYLIALRSPRSKLPPLHGGSATVLLNQQPELLTLLQAPCSGTFILDNSPQNISDVRTILNGGKVANRSFSTQVGEDMRRSAQQLASTRKWALVGKIALVSLVLGIMVLLFAIWMRKRRARGRQTLPTR